MKSHSITIGCDPELFIRGGDGIIGAEKIIGRGENLYNVGSIIPDGVQLELNPNPKQCRELLIARIAVLIRKAHQMLSGGQTLDFGQMVEVTTAEYDTLSDSCKTFGCKPSYNINMECVDPPDPAKYLIRTGGGHIHLGVEDPHALKTLQNAHRSVKTLDVVLGNTLVLLDRSTGNIERRKYYGRAGEYRLPKYGLEYRTPSNFWLSSPTMASLAFGLARHAVELVLNNLDESICDLVDYNDVVQAINENDFDLAKKNWDKIKSALVETTDVTVSRQPINQMTVKKFDLLVEQGIQKYLPLDNESITRLWITCSGSGVGAYDFLTQYVNED